MADRFWLDKPYATAKRLGPKDHVYMEKSGLRVERESPTHLFVQWRVASTTTPGSGTITHGSLSKKEVEALRDYLTAILSELAD